MSPRMLEIQQVFSAIFTLQKELRRLAPEFKWAGLGNLLGDYGECIAVDHYGLTKAPTGADGYDAITADGKTVQVKTNHAASQIGFRGNADLLLVVQIDAAGEWQEIYFGPFLIVAQQARYSARDNKQMIAVAKLRALAISLAS